MADSFNITQALASFPEGTSPFSADQTEALSGVQTEDDLVRLLEADEALRQNFQKALGEETFRTALGDAAERLRKIVGPIEAGLYAAGQRRWTSPPFSAVPAGTAPDGIFESPAEKNMQKIFETLRQELGPECPSYPHFRQLYLELAPIFADRKLGGGGRVIFEGRFLPGSEKTLQDLAHQIEKSKATVHGIERRLTELLGQRLLAKVLWLSVDLDDLQSKLNLPVFAIDFSTRVVRSLRELNIYYLGELVQMSEGELLRKEGLGRKSLREIKEFLAAMDLSLGMTVDWPPAMPDATTPAEPGKEFDTEAALQEADDSTVEAIFQANEWGNPNTPRQTAKDELLRLARLRLAKRFKGELPLPKVTSNRPNLGLSRNMDLPLQHSQAVLTVWIQKGWQAVSLSQSERRGSGIFWQIRKLMVEVLQFPSDEVNALIKRAKEEGGGGGGAPSTATGKKKTGGGGARGGGLFNRRPEGSAHGFRLTDWIQARALSGHLKPGTRDIWAERQRAHPGTPAVPDSPPIIVRAKEVLTRNGLGDLIDLLMAHEGETGFEEVLTQIIASAEQEESFDWLVQRLGVADKLPNRGAIRPGTSGNPVRVPLRPTLPQMIGR